MLNKLSKLKISCHFRVLIIWWFHHTFEYLTVKKGRRLQLKTMKITQKVTLSGKLTLLWHQTMNHWAWTIFYLLLLSFSFVIMYIFGNNKNIRWCFAWNLDHIINFFLLFLKGHLPFIFFLCTSFVWLHVISL